MGLGSIISALPHALWMIGWGSRIYALPRANGRGYVPCPMDDVMGIKNLCPAPGPMDDGMGINHLCPAPCPMDDGMGIKNLCPAPGPMVGEEQVSFLARKELDFFRNG